MADKYANWADLAAHETEGVDYRLYLRPNTPLMAHIAIHGGSIEAGSSESADFCAAWTASNWYALIGIKPANNTDLHITSTNYDEPSCLALQARMNYTFSWHGFTGTDLVPETAVGGLDIVNRDRVIYALRNAGFTANIATGDIAGTDPENITNKNLRSMGVQIELSNQQRQDFFPGGNLSRANRETGIRTDTFYRYMNAVCRAIYFLNSDAQQTPNYHFNKPRPSDQMNDFETWINSNWYKVADMVAPPIISDTDLPQSGNYNLGDRIYHTATQSIYILVVKSDNWGYHWRPVHAAISPWVTVPQTALKATGWTVDIDPAKPFQIALGSGPYGCFWRGVIGVPGGQMTRGTNYVPIRPLPFGLRPRVDSQFILGFEGLSVNELGLEAWQGCRIKIHKDSSNDTAIRMEGGNGLNAPKTDRIYFDGKVQYSTGLA